MQTQQVIQNSANVIRITNIKPGDVYKRFDPSRDDKIVYGIVKNIHNDGEQTFVDTVEYVQEYGNLNINIKVLNGTKDYSIFPAAPEDLATEFDHIVIQKEAFDRDQAERNSKTPTRDKEIEDLVSGVTTANLQQMEYKELSQATYNAKKLEAGL